MNEFYCLTQIINVFYIQVESFGLIVVLEEMSGFTIVMRFLVGTMNICSNLSKFAPYFSSLSDKRTVQLSKYFHGLLNYVIVPEGDTWMLQVVEDLSMNLLGKV